MLCAGGLLAASLWAQSDTLELKSQQAKQLMASGNYAEAISIYRQMTQAAPGNIGLVLNLGIAEHMAGGHDREAVTHFQAVLKQQPNALPALILIGASYLRVGEPAKAVAPLEKAVAANPGDPETLQMLADALVTLNRNGEAVTRLKTLAELDPRNPKVWYSLGHCYESLSQQSFEKLQKLAPGSSYVLSLLAETRKTQGRKSAAEALEKEALSAQKNESNKAAADLFTQTRTYNQLALDAFSHLPQLPPSVELHQLLAETMRNQERHQDSIEEWKKALELSPGNPAIERELAVSVYLTHNFEAAEPLLRTALQHEPASPELNFSLGDTLLNLQKPEEAIPLLKKAPKLPAAHATLGRALMQTNQPAEAIPHLKAALPLDDDGSLRYQLSRAYQVTGQTQLADQMMAEYRKIVKARESAKPGQP